MREKHVSAPLMYTVLVLMNLVMMIVALASGVSGYGFTDIVRSLLTFSADSRMSVVLFSLRLPRILIAIIAGASLAVSGVLMQSVLGNPLADPGSIGISSGASLAISLLLFFFPEKMELAQLAGFSGAIIASLLVLYISWNTGMNSIHIVLAGVAVNSLIGGVNSFLQAIWFDRMQMAILWINGTLSGRSWSTVSNLAVYALPGLLLSLAAIRSANILMLGDESARSLGLNVKRTRLLLSVLAAYLAAVTVANIGIIGFIGLIVPHAVRFFTGSDHGRLIPMSMLAGSFTLLCADTAGRSLVSYLEIPAGTVMTIIGGVFFLYLIKKNGGSCNGIQA